MNEKAISGKSASRKDMESALQNSFVPALRQRKFKGSFPHFRRIGPSQVDLLTIQFDKHGGGFVIEIARASTSGFTTHWGKHIPAEKLSAWDLHPKERHRLGSPAPGNDGRWFRFDDGTPVETVAEETVGVLEEAENWWTV